MADTLRGKALTFLLEQVKVVDAEGNAVELDLPRRPEPAVDDVDDAADADAGSAYDADVDDVDGDARDDDDDDEVAGDTQVGPTPGV